jgi:cytochrome P450
VQMMIDKHEHAIRRRTIAPAFSERALQDAESIIAIHARKLTSQIGSLPDNAQPGSWTEPKNMSHWATYFGFDFVGDLGYGSSFEMLDKEEYRWIPPTLMSGSKFLYYVGYLPFAALVRPFLGSSLQNYIGGQEAADSLKYTLVANQRLADRMALEKKMRGSGDSRQDSRKDTFYYLLNSKDPVTGKAFTTEELQADSALIIAAGSDGVALTISATIFYLLRNPSALSRLVSTIRSAFTSASEIQNPILSSLSYLTACIDETLRLCPPKASSLPREVLAGGITIDNDHFPCGTTLGTPIYVLHHDSTIYPDPWSYCPERWIPDPKTGVSPESVAAARAAFCPFLIGPMNCIGKNMAYIAVKFAIAHMLFRYDVRQAEQETGGGGKVDHPEEGRRRVDEYQMRDYILGFRDGPVVQLRDRMG